MQTKRKADIPVNSLSRGLVTQSYSTCWFSIVGEKPRFSQKILREQNYGCDCLSRGFLSRENVQYDTCEIWNVNRRDAFRVIARPGAKSRFSTLFSCLKLFENYYAGQNVTAPFCAFSILLFVSHSPFIFFYYRSRECIYYFFHLNWKSSAKFDLPSLVGLAFIDSTRLLGCFVRAERWQREKWDYAPSAAITPTACIRSR